MSEFKGTPGPWSTKLALQAEVEGDLHVIQAGMVGDKAFHIAYGAAWTDSPDTAAEAAANARLISAAPDLLAALQAVLSVADRATVEFDMARAAISKATGE